MQFVVKSNYNFDVCNLLNALSGDEFYTQYHQSVFEHFQPDLSADARQRLASLGEERGNHMFGPEMCLLVSAHPDCETLPLAEILADPEAIRAPFRETPYYSDENWPKNLHTLETLTPVALEVEALGLRNYWEEHEQAAIQAKVTEIEGFAQDYDLAEEINALLGAGQAPEQITVYISAYARPHGIKITGPRYVSDVNFRKETTLSIAIHEMFHPPFDHDHMKAELAALMADEFFKEAFETQDPKFGYQSPEGFMEENVVEAMGIFIAAKLGLEPEPLKYFAGHDEGSHVLSVLLFNAFGRRAKSAEQPFEGYLKGLLAELPVGAMRGAYLEIMGEHAPERFATEG